MPREQSHEIDRLAADWAAKLDRGPLDESQEQALEAWLAADSRHLGAFAKARAVAVTSHRARALGATFDSDPSTEQPAGLSRRTALWFGGAAAASLASFGAYSILSREEAYVTQMGEMRVVRLADGSVLTLNTASRAQVAYTDQARVVRLLEGEMLFDVAKDPRRPFTVEAGDTNVRAVGTSFSVKRLGGAPVQILVREGIVEIDNRKSGGKPIRLPANRRVVATADDPRIAVVTPVEVTRQLAWRQGDLSFEGETLAEAAREFARYSEKRIRIDDPSVANERIVGLFAANDPVTFAEAAAASLELQADVSGSDIRLRR